MNRQTEIIERFNVCRQKTEDICKPLEIEDYVPQPIIDVSPPKWHLGHTAWFFEAFVLEKFHKDYQQYHADFSFLFNSYYNNAGERVLRPNRGLMSRPPVREVMAYRKHVTGKVVELFQKEQKDEVLDIIELGINHEEQHQELLVYDIKYILGHQPLFPVYGHQFMTEKENEEMNWIKIPGGLYEIGAGKEGFSYDNEHQSHQVNLGEFTIANRLVSNGDYLEFIDSGGYSDFNLWHAEGWDFIQNHGLKAPLYWHQVNGKWHTYDLGGLEKINPNKPVQHISFYEAAAFAEWKGCRLPTEFEWEAAADKFKWGQLWEWTYSAYHPYPGFQKAAGALGEYNGKFMLNQNVLRGASVATAAGHSRKTYRNFFHTASRWMFAGIRLAK